MGIKIYYSFSQWPRDVSHYDYEQVAAKARRHCKNAALVLYLKNV
jgi:hypothetical protein